MDPLLALVIVLIGFAVVIFLIGRSVRWVMIVGALVAVYLAARFLGVLG